MTNNPQSVRDVKAIGPTWRFYTLWVFANGIGTIIGVIIFFLLLVSLGFLSTPFPGQQTELEGIWKMITGISIITIPFGGIIGAMQWLVLRKHITNSWFWFVTSAIAMFIGNTISGVMPMFFQLPPTSNLFLTWFLFGGVSGVLQWIIMRRQINYSGFWILANVIAGGITGIFLPDFGIIGGSIGWALTGIITGGVPFMLLKKTNRDDYSQIAT
jgi:hypothetical protein